jgi:hypothetical protein
MVNVNIQFSTRAQRRSERLERIKKARPQISGVVRVIPRDDDVRRVLRHPNGIGFRSEGSSEWPNDRFTKRRIADGSVTVEAAAEETQSATEEEPRRRY